MDIARAAGGGGQWPHSALCIFLFGLTDFPVYIFDHLAHLSVGEATSHSAFNCWTGLAHIERRLCKAKPHAISVTD